jgi:hypothetical protein
MFQMPLANDIAAVLPYYANTQDGTIIITNDEQKICCPHRLRTVLKQIAYELCLDLGTIKKHAAKATGQAILHPLPLGQDVLLVPIKVRIPPWTGQPSIGYVNLYRITAVFDSKAVPYRATIELCGKIELPVIWTSATIKKQLRNARLSLTELPSYPTAPRNLQMPPKPELRPLAHKLIELMYDILLLKK